MDLHAQTTPENIRRGQCWPRFSWLMHLHQKSCIKRAGVAGIALRARLDKHVHMHEINVFSKKTPMNEIETFQSALLENDCSYIYRKYLLGHDVWYFREILKKTDHAHFYDDLKIYMSQALNIHINNIAIVGSAKLGFSLAPTDEKAFRPFYEGSDIDIVVVSSELFRASWMAFLELTEKTKIPNYKNITSNIFRKFVSLKGIDEDVDFFRRWQRKMEPCQKDLQIVYSIPNDINYRIYDTWEDVERYHLKGLEKLKLMVEEKK